MRTALLSLGIVAACLLAAWTVVDRRVELPPVGPSVEQTCAETMQRAADLSWVAQNREAKVLGREINTVTLGELPSHSGSLVRVVGVLHAEFEWVALYPSRAAMEEQSWRAPWVTLGSLWPDEPYWRTKGPSISDRCVVVEGTYSGGAGGHMGMFNGTIGDVLRLDVWSSPHRPFVTMAPPPPPPPAAPPGSEKPAPPKRMLKKRGMTTPNSQVPTSQRVEIAADGHRIGRWELEVGSGSCLFQQPPKPKADAAAGQEMLAEFKKLYETGEFQLGYCLADVQVNEEGTVDAVRIVRPQNVDRRVESAIVRSIKARQYTPATACGRPVPFALSVGVGHCPSRAERKPDR